jgi:cell pole-organizing protein PopZ
MLADLERRVVFHREQEAVHTERETFHHQERERHAAALAEVAQQLAMLKAAASGAEALLRQAAPLPAPPEDASASPPRMVSRMVALVVKDWPAEGSFGASTVAAEVEHRFGAALDEPVSVLNVARSLLRLRKKGVLRTLRKGLPYAESLFRKNAA